MNATDCVLCQLSHLGIIRASGADVRTFLQGQLTNDIQQVTEAQGQLNGYCNPKGRLLASFRIMQQQDDLLLLLPRDNLDATLQRLRMFVLRSQVTLEDVSESMMCLELAGDCATEMLGVLPPEQDHATCLHDGFVLARIPGDRQRIQVIGNTTEVQTLYAKLADHAETIDTAHWRLLDIRAGLPTVYASTREAFVPQMANMHWVDGVNFQKGCYTGQEVVARMQYLGKLKRRMYRVQFTANQLPAPGDEVYAANSPSEQSVGKVVDVAPDTQDGYEALVIIQTSHAETGTLQLGGVDGPTLELLSLPYPTLLPD